MGRREQFWDVSWLWMGYARGFERGMPLCVSDIETKESFQTWNTAYRFKATNDSKWHIDFNLTLTAPTLPHNVVVAFHGVTHHDTDSPGLNSRIAIMDRLKRHFLSPRAIYCLDPLMIWKRALGGFGRESMTSILMKLKWFEMNKIQKVR